jgi:hypothetical protein
MYEIFAQFFRTTRPFGVSVVDKSRKGIFFRFSSNKYFKRVKCVTTALHAVALIRLLAHTSGISEHSGDKRENEKSHGQRFDKVIISIFE